MTDIIDDLKTPSTTEDLPLFSIKNMFKPTSKNVVLWATTVKLACASVVGGLMFMIAKDPHYYAIIVLLCVLVGGIAELFVLFTKQDPLSTLIRAAEDIKINPQQAIDALTTLKDDTNSPQTIPST